MDAWPQDVEEGAAPAAVRIRRLRRRRSRWWSDLAEFVVRIRGRIGLETYVLTCRAVRRISALPQFRTLRYCRITCSHPTRSSERVFRLSPPLPRPPHARDLPLLNGSRPYTTSHGWALVTRIPSFRTVCPRIR